MSEKDFRELAFRKVIDYYNNKVSVDDIYVVWECKTLQNNKMLLSTTVPDGMYFEFTWNGDKCEGYLDTYKKLENIVCHFVTVEE